MPTVTPAYLYTFLAMIAVSTLLVLSFMAYVNALRLSSETGQLGNLMDLVAAKSTELVTIVLKANGTAETFLQMPTVIGERQYWLQLRNDSSSAWIEAGFGNRPVENMGSHVDLPSQIVAKGYFVGGYGAANLRCEISSGLPSIELTNSSGVG